MALHKEKFPLLADTLQAAAGVAGKQKWALILPSSARVSLVTYTTVIAVRCPELDNSHDGLTCFGNYLLGAQSTHGGFLPVFWNAPTDENGCLAVLHNRNKMVTTFGNSEWVTQAEGVGAVQECHFLCRDDSTSCLTGANSSWVFGWRKLASS